MLTEKNSNQIDAASAIKSDSAPKTKLTPLRYADKDDIQIADFRSII